MKKITLALVAAAAFAVGPVFAQTSCVGSDAYKTCYDTQTGNNYNIQRYGNTTSVQGYNAQTGSNWSQNSSTYGNTTYHNGTAADGNSWSGTTSTYGGTTYNSGTDSRGNYYNKTCNKYGCY